MTVYGCGADELALFEQLAPRFGIAPTITAAPLSEENVALARGNRCVSVGHRARIADATLLALSRVGVRHLLTRSIGTDHLDVTYAARVGVSVSTVAYSPHSVADHTLMLILMALRSTGPVLSRAAGGDFRLPEARGKELHDLTVGVIGTGRIGAAVIDRLRGFGCRVLATDRPATRTAGRVSLEELVRRSDLVTLHTPLTAETHHLLDRRRIAQMKRGSYVVNTARGPLIDTEALVRALERGWLAGAALDVLEGEEGIFYEDCTRRALDDTLLSRVQALPNVVITPHIAYFTDRALRDTVEQTLLGCVSFERRRRRG